MKSINTFAPVKCGKSITINSNSKNVWEIMTNINNWANWQNEIKNPKLNGSLKVGSTFDWKTGGAKVHSTLHTVDPVKEFGWTGKTFGMLAIHNWTIKENDGITTVVVEESMEGFLASVLRKSFNKNLEKGMLHWLEQLKKEAERKL